MSYHYRVRAGAFIIENDSILLIEFNDENGLHYNLPAGGVQPNETVKEAVRREAMEEASIEVEVGPLEFVYEYVPHLNHDKFGDNHSLQLIFECSIKEGCKPQLPKHPDPNQTDVRWIKLTDLKGIVLFPDMSKYILNYIENKRTIEIIEEHLIENQTLQEKLKELPPL
ncbi:NUDIX domain-containing protein [Bacillus carboniphilus]|uniref:NUDIX domain-containing protein n=1 Tax=Bacillus carboniphilus TaxID=86663 RepID=A0ABY9JS38_9BACI|nr:NUDIX domain-containing protein [Bacillus carboniphilus]WLR42220.1 NUDIX domain-containing protein [Bacillus carboniphilus]